MIWVALYLLGLVVTGAAVFAAGLACQAENPKSATDSDVFGIAVFLGVIWPVTVILSAIVNLGNALARRAGVRRGA